MVSSASDDLEADPERAARLCQEAHARLLAALSGIGDQDVRQASRLPGWTVGHVITHLARNADAHARRLAGALEGADVPKYVGGAGQREEEIESGASRPADVMIADLKRSQEHLDRLLVDCSAAGWPGGEFFGGSDYPVTACPTHRLREVEVHHVDLGIGYEPSDWPVEYVAWDLNWFLATVPGRPRSDEDRALAWLAGRIPFPSTVRLDPP